MAGVLGWDHQQTKTYREVLHEMEYVVEGVDGWGDEAAGQLVLLPEDSQSRLKEARIRAEVETRVRSEMAAAEQAEAEATF